MKPSPTTDEGAHPDLGHVDAASSTGTSPPENFITAHEVAERLGVTKATVLAWHRDGVIPAYRPPGRVRPVRFRWSEIESAMVIDEVAS